jgi:hypothetical protein
MAGEQREDEVLRAAGCGPVALVRSFNQTNQRDQINEIDQFYRPWRGCKMFLNT